MVATWLAAMLLGMATTANGAPLQDQRQAGVQFNVLIAEAKAAMLVDPARTIAQSTRAERLAATLSPPERVTGIATSEWLRGEAYLRLNNVSRAKPFIDQALKRITGVGTATKLKGDLLLSRAGINTVEANVAAALFDYQAAHNIFRDIKETRSQTIALISIAILYQQAADFENALKYYRQASDVKGMDPQLRLTVVNNTAGCFLEMGRHADAETKYREALALARRIATPMVQVQILRNIARTQLKSGELAAADRTIAEQDRIAKRNNIPDSEGQSVSVAAQAAFQHGDLPRATALIARSFAGVDLRGTTLVYRGSHETAYEIYKRIGNEDLALRHLEALKRLDDKKSTLAASANTSLAAARFDFANQELRISKLKADELQRNIDYERAQARTRQNIATGISAIVVIVVGLLAFGIVTLRRSRNQVRAANIDLAATNNALGKALAAKTEFLATTSHEIRTPLNGILGMTQVMLADPNLAAPVRERIGVVHGAGVTMRALVDDILDVAKMETGNLTIERAPLDLRATLGDVTKMWAEQARARGIGFVLDLDDAPAWIEGDAARLRQIVFNLLSNALKFTERGDVTLRVRTVGDRLRVCLTDSGIGIPADKHELIFESFRQVDAGTTRKFGGTGLGLAICRNLARAMDGDVRVESAPGEGATFILDLPLIPAEAPTAAPEAGGRALLIVDRSPITRSMLRALLEARAGEVIFASSAEEAVAKLDAGLVAQVLIDDATVKAAANRDAALSAIADAARRAEVPTSLLWVANDDTDRATLLSTGIGQIIEKPIAGVVLAEKLYVSDKSFGAQLVSRAA